MRSTELDDWLPDPAVRTHHRRAAAASPETVWESAREVRLADTPRLGRLVRWRIPGTSGQQTFRGLLAEYPFVVLAEGEHWSISGLCGRIWTLHRDYGRLDGPDAFTSWKDPGTVRVLFGTWIEPDGAGRSALVSEARVAPVDRAAALRLRSLWLVIGMFERLIGGEALEHAVARAQQRARA